MPTPIVFPAHCEGLVRAVLVNFIADLPTDGPMLSVAFLPVVEPEGLRFTLIDDDAEGSPEPAHGVAEVSDD